MKLKQFVRLFVRPLIMLVILTIAVSVLAQTPAPAPAPAPSPWTLQSLEHWYAVATVIGSALSAFLAIVIAQVPQLTWLSKLATLLGALPVLDLHGLTTGKMQERMHAALTVAKASTAVTGATEPAPPPSAAVPPAAK